MKYILHAKRRNFNMLMVLCAAEADTPGRWLAVGVLFCGNRSNNCRDTSLWTKLLDRPLIRNSVFIETKAPTETYGFLYLCWTNTVVHEVLSPVICNTFCIVANKLLHSVEVKLCKK